MKSRGSGLLKLTAVASSIAFACAAQANPLLPVQNLTFSSYTGYAPKTLFSAVKPTSWYRGTPGPQGDLVSIDAPGTATVNSQAHGNSYPVYGPFADPPPGGNFVQADGNPDFESSFNQDISGLTVGQTYDLSFWQAAGQQQGFTGDTTEQWIVALGSLGSVLNVNFYSGTANCGSNISCGKYYDTDSSAEIHTSTLMNTPSQGVSPWNQVTLSFTATAATQTLSFLAWGDNGNTENLPPTVFLAGVNSPALPEPGSLALFGAAFIGLGVTWLRRGKRDPQA